MLREAAQLHDQLSSAGKLLTGEPSLSIIWPAT